MEVYHASSVIVEHPDTKHSRNYLDFGSGFYVTTMLEQAQKYGVRFTRRGRKAIINTYELSDDFTKWKVIKFEHYDEEWLDFVTESRAGRTVGEYDIVIGGIANDKVFRTILEAKYARIINEISAMHDIALEEAMDIFYNSPLLPLLEDGVADLHCRSDKYLAEEIWYELNGKS